MGILSLSMEKYGNSIVAKLNKYRASGTALCRVTNGRSKASELF